MNAPTRPVLRWHGGKWKLAPWIIGHFPPHRIYVEPYGGAASVLLRKQSAFSEIYNDLDEDVVNLFRVLRDAEQAMRLVELLRLTPFARAEFDLSWKPAETALERARRLVVRSFMGYGSDSATIAGNTGFRAQSPQSGRSPEKDWRNHADALEAIVARLRDIVVECRPALDLMARHDSPTTLHYVDPPYLPETRSTKSRKGGQRYHAYRHELTDADHVALLDALDALDRLAGMVVLSGYPAQLYDDRLGHWRRVEIKALADGARERTEVLWLNPACADALDASKGADLFAEAAE